MPDMRPRPLRHPKLSRRTAVQAGALGLYGLGSHQLRSWQAQAASLADGSPGRTSPHKAKACIYIFLSGGLSQHESFDLKPHAPAEIRGEFNPISTTVPGVQISEHLPKLAACCQDWSVLRSLTHPTNDHTAGHYYMLTGRSLPSPGFTGDRLPRPSDWPSIASIAGDALRPRAGSLPPAVVLPERLVHWSGGVIPGAYGGQMGSHRDPFFIEASPYGNPFWRGAYPEYTFANETKKPPAEADSRLFEAPSITLSPGMDLQRLSSRAELLGELDRQRAALEQSAAGAQYDGHRQSAISLLASQQIRAAFDVTRADAATQDRYGRNSFGWSLLMAYQLVAAGVSLVQVNLGNNETWDTHGEIFHRLKDKLFPPTDRALCALLADLRATGLLDSTLLVMASEFGRTPKLSVLDESYPTAGRDHWGAVQSVWFAGGGIQGGRVVGSSDKLGAYPSSNPYKPEDMAATIYHALGIPSTAAWHDELNRPHHIYHGQPIVELL